MVPAPLFSMTGSHLVSKYYTWSLVVEHARPLEAGVQPATIDNFRLDKKQYYARVVLSRRIDGPQDVVLKMTMNVTSFYDNFEGKAESRIYLYITPAGDVDHL